MRNSLRMFGLLVAFGVNMSVLLASGVDVSLDPHRITNSCKVIDQDGSIDSWYCQNSANKIRCYADINDGGHTYRVLGQGCYASYDACWWNGPGRVNPCS